jgi:hypothetical protein
VASRIILQPAFILVSFSAYFFDPEDGGDMFLRNGLHGVISQKMVLFNIEVGYKEIRWMWTGFS